MNRTFDRVVQFDERSRNYGIAEVLEAQKPRKRYWGHNTVIDQGREGACVGFAWTNELICNPRPHPDVPQYVGDAFARKIYKRAQQLDPWPGENYEGTSVLAGAKAIMETGYLTQYRWAFNIEQVRDAVIAEGPVILGINWYDSMYSTRPSGLVEVGGKVVGGHAIALTGYNPRARLKGEGGYKEVFRWKNSWGTSYGKNGTGYVKIEDLERLLKEDGEACIPMGRSLVRF